MQPGRRVSSRYFQYIRFADAPFGRRVSSRYFQYIRFADAPFGRRVSSRYFQYIRFADAPFGRRVSSRYLLKRFSLFLPLINEFSTAHIVNSVTSAFCITDLNRRIIYINEYGLELCRMTLDEIVGTLYSSQQRLPRRHEILPDYGAGGGPRSRNILRAGQRALCKRLRQLFNTMAGIIRPRCDEKGIVFNIYMETFSPSAFLSDSLRLRQVLINLLGNAVKFAPEHGTIEFGVKKKAHDEDRALMEFSVRDIGIGISEEASATIFQSFEQGNGNISRQYGGTGLGLAISRRIVQLFGGDIDVKSVVGEGSEFSFDIWMRETDSVFIGERAEADIAGKKALRRG